MTNIASLVPCTHALCVGDQLPALGHIPSQWVSQLASLHLLLFRALGQRRTTPAGRVGLRGGGLLLLGDDFLHLGKRETGCQKLLGAKVMDRVRTTRDVGR